MYYVYLIKQRDKTIYFGYTTDLKRRLKEHRATPERLVYYEAYRSKGDAMERERQLKKYKSAWGQVKKRIARSRT